MHSTLKFLLLPALAAFAPGGCASRTASRMGTAATAPLNDLGIRKAEVPAVLEKAQENPYLMPAAAKHEESFMDKASDVAEDQAVGAMQRTAEGLIPFRSWIRKLSGAERQSKHVSACVTAGSVRRAFLKGLAVSQHCTLPEIPTAPKKS
jgi:hypothetical protein